MDHFVTLESLPEGIRLPQDMADRVGYDAERKRLWYRGWMCKAEYDRLFLLSQDWTYRRKLEGLFQICVPDDHRSRRGARLAALVGAGVALTAALVIGWQVWSARSISIEAHGSPTTAALSPSGASEPGR